MMEGSGSLEQQLEATKRKAAEVRARRSDLKKIEDLGAILEEHLILDNRYTEHSTVGLAQQWDQLDQLGMRMQHNLEQQIQARNQSGKCLGICGQHENLRTCVHERKVHTLGLT